MTVEEAIDYLSKGYCDTKPTDDKDMTKLKHKHNDAYEIAIEALEKQIPKKIKVINHIYHYCPSCDLYFDNREWKSKYCGRCGQKIDWSDEE